STAGFNRGLPIQYARLAAGVTPRWRSPTATGAVQQVHIMLGSATVPATKVCPNHVRRFIALSSQTRGTRASIAAASSKATAPAFHTAAKYVVVKRHVSVHDGTESDATNMESPSQTPLRPRDATFSAYGSHFAPLRPTTSTSANTATPTTLAGRLERGDGLIGPPNSVVVT